MQGSGTDFALHLCKKVNQGYKVRPQDIYDRINEFSRIRPGAGSDEAKLLEAALFVEDVFGLRLIDDEICEENLGSHASMAQFIIKKLEAI